MFSTTKNFLLGFGFVFFLLVNFNPIIFAQTSEEKTVTTLQPEKTIGRELAGGQSHKYSIEVKANEFLQIKVEQKGVDIVVKLLNPSGKLLAEMDSPNGVQGLEILKFIVADAGVYTVEISSLEAKAAKGNYTIFREMPRIANEKDKKRLKANKLFADANLLFSKRTAEAVAQAISKFEEARLLFQEVGDKEYEAHSLGFLGFIYFMSGNGQKTLESSNQAIPLFRAINDKNGEAAMLNNISKVYAARGENPKALDFLNQALILQIDADDKDGIGTTLTNMGHIYFELGNIQKAIETYNKALPIFQSINNKVREAVVSNNIGLAYDAQGEKQKALEFYNRALNLRKITLDRNGEAVSLTNIGKIYTDLGDFQKALIYFNQALLIIREVVDKSSEAAILGNIGAIYAKIGDNQKAFDYLNQALPLQIAINDKVGEASTLNNIGRAKQQLGEWQKALESYNRALVILKAGGYKNGEAVTLNNIGLLYHNLGQHQKALDYYNQSLPIYKSASDKQGEAMAFHNAMLIWEDLSNIRLSILYGKQSVNLFQSLRADIKGLDKDLQKKFLGTVEGTYRKLALLLIKEGRLPEAEQVLEMLKDEEYFRFVRRDDKVAATLLNTRINLSASEKDALARYEKIADEITKLGDQYSKLETEINKPQLAAKQKLQLIARRNEVDKKLADARTALRLFLEELKKEFSRKDERIASVEKGLQAAVKSWNDSHAVVISTIVGEKNLSIIVTTPDIQRAHIIEVAEEDLNKLIAEFRSVVLDIRTDAKPAAQKLYDLLVKPLEKDLDGVQAKTLVWSLDGNLRYVPIAALWDGKRGFLAENYNNVIITLTSRDSLAISPVGKNKWQALGVGVSKEVAGFSRLDNVTSELQAIIRDGNGAGQSRIKENGVLAGRRFLNEQFTYDSFRNNLGIYPVVHAATHFKFDLGANNDGMDSFLLLGSGEKLTLAQVRDAGTIFTGIQLLTLSACDTAYGGKNSDGSEIEGFGVMAQEKGAKAVMATLWRVADESTREFMVDFYRTYQKNGVTKAEALRQAQVRLMKNEKYAHPYFWSPFILIGNWK
ncbi:MAG TPA: tetratricopeptide repeat protein [Pyrinomonadaceae bacterium]